MSESTHFPAGKKSWQRAATAYAVGRTGGRWQDIMTKKILVVDDDPHILEVISFALKKADMEVVTAADGKDALKKFENQNPHLVVLDINMPEMDGLEVCRKIRKEHDTPILFLSSRDEEIDRILGLEIGGDDYVTKPFSPRELAARVNVILKRAMKSRQKSEDEGPLQHGKLVMEPDKHEVRWDGARAELTATEYAILLQFLRDPERVHHRDRLMHNAYGGSIHVSDRTIDSHIRRIRHKFEDMGCASVIETVHGVGYKLGSCD